MMGSHFHILRRTKGTSGIPLCLKRMLSMQMNQVKVH